VEEKDRRYALDERLHENAMYHCGWPGELLYSAEPNPPSRQERTPGIVSSSPPYGCMRKAAWSSPASGRARCCSTSPQIGRRTNQNFSEWRKEARHLQSSSSILRFRSSLGSLGQLASGHLARSYTRVENARMRQAIREVEQRN